MKPASTLPVIVVWLLLAAATLAIALPRIDDHGLYYDEAFLAQQARDFVEPERAGVHPPSVTTAYIAGRPFPVRNAAYLGSLKSQLLIPGFAAFGSSVFVLRATTLAIGLLGLLFFMLVAKRWFGGHVAAATGVLVATDPSFYFFAQFEWGPFTSMLLCRGAGLYCLTRAFDPEARGSRWIAAVIGAALMGLGVYSRVDFVVILAGIAVALLVCRRELAVFAWRTQRSMLIVASAAFVVSVIPVVAVVGQVLGAGAGISDRGDLAYRISVLASTLDGSHFHRLISAGGLFDEVFSQTGPVTALPVLIFVALGVLLTLNRAREGQRASGVSFLLLTALLIAVGMLAIPGAVRAHHMLNVLPFTHMIVAVAGTDLWRRSWSSARRQSIVRICVAAALAACLWSNAVSIATTRDLLRDTGGTGRFSVALQELVRQLEASPDAGQTAVVSLDWGFHEIALFTSDRISLNEPIWKMGGAARRASATTFNGNRFTVYLYHDPPYDLFGYGRAFAAALDASDSDHYSVAEHHDRRGGLVFKSVRFDAPHRMTFDGNFHIRLSAATSPPPAPAAAR